MGTPSRFSVYPHVTCSRSHLGFPVAYAADRECTHASPVWVSHGFTMLVHGSQTGSSVALRQCWPMGHGPTMGATHGLPISPHGFLVLAHWYRMGFWRDGPWVFRGTAMDVLGPAPQGLPCPPPWTFSAGPWVTHVVLAHRPSRGRSWALTCSGRPRVTHGASMRHPMRCPRRARRSTHDKDQI